MEFDNQFNVPLPPAEAWRVLMDIQRIAPCMPGAELTEKIDDRAYKGKVGVRLGPVALSFAGTARFEEIDDYARTARVKAAGVDGKGRGGANATASFRVEAAPDGSVVLVHTNLTLSGAVAQYGRGVGMIQEVASELIRQFSTNLRQMIEAEGLLAAPVADAPQPLRQPLPAPPTPPARPISGISLMLRVLWNAIRRLFAA
jgi:carbon monoxide dehydrogenase subunit G